MADLRSGYADWQVVTNDDVVILNLGLFTTARSVQRVKRSWSWVHRRHRI